METVYYSQRKHWNKCWLVQKLNDCYLQTKTIGHRFPTSWDGQSQLASHVKTTKYSHIRWSALAWYPLYPSHGLPCHPRLISGPESVAHQEYLLSESTCIYMCGIYIGSYFVFDPNMSSWSEGRRQWLSLDRSPHTWGLHDDLGKNRKCHNNHV